jgi:hypothetical protein
MMTAALETKFLVEFLIIMRDFPKDNPGYFLLFWAFISLLIYLHKNKDVVFNQDKKCLKCKTNKDNQIEKLLEEMLSNTQSLIEISSKIDRTSEEALEVNESLERLLDILIKFITEWRK